MVPICGPFYKEKNSSWWYYENPNMKLFRGDRMILYFKIICTNVTRRKKVTARVEIPLGPPPKVTMSESIEDSNDAESMSNKPEFNIFKFI